MSIEKGFDSAENQNLSKIRAKAQKGDVTHDLSRSFRKRLIAKDPEILEIQKQGFISAAKLWIESTSAEGLKLGHASKEERLAKAQELADKAGVSMEELLNQNQ